MTDADRVWLADFVDCVIWLAVECGERPLPLAADDWLRLLGEELAHVEEALLLEPANRDVLAEVAAWAGLSRAARARWWTRQRADAARLRRLLRDPQLQSLLLKWEDQNLFGRPAGR
jgi:hypothetical protein